jgi:hypothetical protein
MANTPKTLNIRAKIKPALPDKDPGETGYQLYNGGGGVHLTQTSLQPRIPRNSAILNNEIPLYKVSRQPGQKFWGHLILGTPYLSVAFGPGFLGLSGRSSSRSSRSMKASSPIGLPVRSCFLKRSICDS